LNHTVTIEENILLQQWSHRTGIWQCSQHQVCNTDLDRRY